MSEIIGITNTELQKNLLEKNLLEKFGQIILWSVDDLIELAKNQKIVIFEEDEILSKEESERLNKQKNTYTANCNYF